MNVRLEEYLRGTTTNVALNVRQYPSYVQHLDQVSGAFGQLLATSGIEGTPTALFFAMSYGAFLAGCSLALSGQAPPSYMAARGCLENALYGFWVHSHPEKLNVWTKRHESAEAKKQVREQFQIGPMVRELALVEQSLANQFQIAYDTTIDFGAHPNYRAIITNLENDARGETQWMAVTNDPAVVKQCLYAVGYCGISALGVAAATFRQALVGSRFAHELIQTWDSWHQLSDPASTGA
jgi:hypothetical protein